MARRLDAFPAEHQPGRRKYPWHEWTDGSVWEVRRGEDYDVATENMRVNLHMKADALLWKVRTHKVTDDRSEGLVFQFFASDDLEEVSVSTTDDLTIKAAMEQLFRDAIEIYERARKEVTIERKDGRHQKYAPVRYKQQIEKGRDEDTLVPTIARIIRKPTLGFGHLENAERPDLMLETLVLNASKPYHRFFSAKTVQVARDRMSEYDDRRR
jgi:hypothetical protein